jgi:hypothetical protein
MTFEKKRATTGIFRLGDHPVGIKGTRESVSPDQGIFQGVPPGEGHGKVLSCLTLFLPFMSFRVQMKNTRGKPPDACKTGDCPR